MNTLTTSHFKKVRTLLIILRIITVENVEENFLQSMIQILCKPKPKLPKKFLEYYDYPIILKLLILSFAFSLILASTFSSNIIINSPDEDKPDDKLTKDFAENLRDAVEDSGVQASSNTVTVSDKIPSPVEGVGISTKP